MVGSGGKGELLGDAGEGSGMRGQGSFEGEQDDEDEALATGAAEATDGEIWGCGVVACMIGTCRIEGDERRPELKGGSKDTRSRWIM